MLEPKAGVFVGRVSAMVRERLWERVCKDAGSKAGATLIYGSENEQGYLLRSWGDPSRDIENHEGLQLVRIKPSTRVEPKAPS
jgi:CRISPR-associated protein Cas2